MSLPVPVRPAVHRPRLVLGVFLAALLLAAAAPLPTARASVTQPLVFLDFHELSSGGAPASTGSLPVSTSVLTAGGGAIAAAPDPAAVDGVADGSASADLPDYDSTSPYQRAGVAVLSQDASDPLSPGAANFEFGADFTVDAKSEGTTADNGNNLVQRGLYADRAQYKLQVDHGHVSCRVKGTSGAPIVASKLTLVPNAWYSASCARVGSALTLRVQPRGGAVEETTLVKPAGTVKMASPSIRLAIGCKLSAAGNLVISNSDQFNGHVDNVYYQVTPTG
jgi:hypothetical protein